MLEIGFLLSKQISCIPGCEIKHFLWKLYYDRSVICVNFINRLLEGSTPKVIQILIPQILLMILTNFLKRQKKSQKFTPIRLEKSPSLPKDGMLSIEDLYFDMRFEHSLFRYKSESDLESIDVDNNFLQIPVNPEIEMSLPSLKEIPIYSGIH